MKDDRLYLHHMVERCHRITRFIGPGKEAFMESEVLQDAVIRNVDLDEVWNVASSRYRSSIIVLERFLEEQSAGPEPVP